MPESSRSNFWARVDTDYAVVQHAKTFCENDLAVGAPFLWNRIRVQDQSFYWACRGQLVSVLVWLALQIPSSTVRKIKMDKQRLLLQRFFIFPSSLGLSYHSGKYFLLYASMKKVFYRQLARLLWPIIECWIHCVSNQCVYMLKWLECKQKGYSPKMSRLSFIY